MQQCYVSFWCYQDFNALSSSIAPVGDSLQQNNMDGLDIRFLFEGRTLLRSSIRRLSLGYMDPEIILQQHIFIYTSYTAATLTRYVSITQGEVCIKWTTPHATNYQQGSKSQVIYLQVDVFNIYSLDARFQVKLHDTARCIVDGAALQEGAGTWRRP
ncbi:predicted protein [Lichtheimia corymbifera JMRC:FSU:9682]|uniref:Uncharacterized protein n=1 Tax=Lichtheimia corymbifera JMRC:FSU:9682 TaxID=1263082 RepID=A0A068RVK7_9FUNG|nr:predicted protein [Lichtheimia corymbifera JMRC:FSU:9682]